MGRESPWLGLGTMPCGGVPVSPWAHSVAAGGCQDAPGLGTAPRPAQGQRLLTRRGHHPRPACAGERGLPVPAHQRRGGLLQPHPVGPSCCPLLALRPVPRSPQPHSRLLSPLLSRRLPGLGEPRGSLEYGLQGPSACQEGLPSGFPLCPPCGFSPCGRRLGSRAPGNQKELRAPEDNTSPWAGPGGSAS